MLAIAASTDPERLRRSARGLLLFRLIEGGVAWYFINHTFLTGGGGLLATGLAQVLFAVYLLSNFRTYRCIAAGQLNDAALAVDLVVNLGTILLAVGASGGASSPLLQLCISKVVFYGSVFSPLAGIIALAGTAAAAGVLITGSEIFGFDLTLLRAPGPGAAELLAHYVSLFCAICGVGWLLEGALEAQARGREEARRTRRAAEREHSAASVAGALLSVSEAISRLTSLDHVLDTVVEIAPAVLRVDSCGILLWDETAAAYRGAAATGLDQTAQSQWVGRQLSPDEVPDLEWVRRLGHCAVLGPREAARVGVPEAPAVLTAPLLSGGQFFGVIFFARRGGQSFTQSDFRLADGVARQTAGAIQRAELVQRQAHLQETLARADRLASAGALAAGVAHEVNNALVGILGEADLARQLGSPDALRASMSRVERQGLRIAEIVQELLGFARPTPPKPASINLSEVVRETIDLIRHEYDRHAVQVSIEIDPGCPPVLADSKQIQQVLINLLTNASQALSAGGTVDVAVRHVEDAVEVSVADNGPGISAEALPRIFDPFYSSKPAGTGLGLSVSYQIVRAHGGELVAESEPGQGAVFRMRLPQATTAPSSGQRILIVDDDDNVAASLRDMLERDGRTVERVACGREAIERLETDRFDAVLLDVRLPDISGPEVFQTLSERHPQQAQRVIFVTGGLWRGGSSPLRQSLPPQPVLSKPCTAPQLRAVLQSLNEQRAAA